PNRLARRVALQRAAHPRAVATAGVPRAMPGGVRARRRERVVPDPRSARDQAPDVRPPVAGAAVRPSGADQPTAGALNAPERHRAAAAAIVRRALEAATTATDRATARGPVLHAP